MPDKQLEQWDFELAASTLHLILKLQERLIRTVESVDVTIEQADRLIVLNEDVARYANTFRSRIVWRNERWRERVRR